MPKMAIKSGSFSLVWSLLCESIVLTMMLWRCKYAIILLYRAIGEVSRPLILRVYNTESAAHDHGNAKLMATFPFPAANRSEYLTGDIAWWKRGIWEDFPCYNRQCNLATSQSQIRCSNNWSLPVFFATKAVWVGFQSQKRAICACRVSQKHTLCNFSVIQCFARHFLIGTRARFDNLIQVIKENGGRFMPSGVIECFLDTWCHRFWLFA